MRHTTYRGGALGDDICHTQLYEHNTGSMYTPNLGLGITILLREREQSCFNGSNRRSKGSGLWCSKGRCTKESEWEAWYPAIVAHRFGFNGNFVGVIA